MLNIRAHTAIHRHTQMRSGGCWHNGLRIICFAGHRDVAMAPVKPISAWGGLGDSDAGFEGIKSCNRGTGVDSIRDGETLQSLNPDFPARLS